MGGRARQRASIGRLGEGRSRCLWGAPAAEMSFSRLCRLLKPALLCGTLAVPGVASTMVSAVPAAGPVGRWGVRAAFTVARRATVTLGGSLLAGRRWAAFGTMGSARAGVQTGSWLGVWARCEGLSGRDPRAAQGLLRRDSWGPLVHWPPDWGPASGGAPWAG